MEENDCDKNLSQVHQLEKEIEALFGKKQQVDADQVEADLVEADLIMPGLQVKTLADLVQDSMLNSQNAETMLNSQTAETLLNSETVEETMLNSQTAETLLKPKTEESMLKPKTAETMLNSETVEKSELNLCATNGKELNRSDSFEIMDTSF